jgi:hypothetical protein
MLKARSVVIATVVVTNLAVGTVTIYAETPTEANFAACNADAPAAMRAGTAPPTAKDYMRVEAARKDGAAIAHSTDSKGRVIKGFSDPQLVGMASEGITDAAYQAAYRSCMRRSGF